MNNVSFVEFGAANDLISSPVLSLPLFKFWYLNLSHSIVHVKFILAFFHSVGARSNSCMKLVLLFAQTPKTNEVFD